MIKDLIKLANHLDKKGFRKEADFLDKIISDPKPVQESRISSEDDVDRIAGEMGVDLMDATDEAELEDTWLQFTSWPDHIQRSIINRVVQEGLDDT